jgi:hypothetical protein
MCPYRIGNVRMAEPRPGVPLRMDTLDTPQAIFVAPPEPGQARGARRRRGRPLLMNREQVLEQIRTIATAGDGLFRMHHQHPGLYARARRQFGSWPAAVRAAGVDYGRTLDDARRRSLETRRRRSKPPG